MLSPPEIEELYHTITSVKQANKAIIFITHKLNETIAISDRVTILRDGAVVGTVNRKDTNPQELARMMVGREVVLRVNKDPQTSGEVVMSVSNFSAFEIEGWKLCEG